MARIPGIPSAIISRILAIPGVLTRTPGVLAIPATIHRISTIAAKILRICDMPTSMPRIFRISRILFRLSEVKAHNQHFMRAGVMVSQIKIGKNWGYLGQWLYASPPSPLLCTQSLWNSKFISGIPEYLEPRISILE